MKKLKLNPADIKYVIVSHAHGDHYGGAAYLKKKFNPKIVMSDIDWKMFDDPKFDPKRIPLFDEPPKRDMAVKDGDTIKLGNSAFKLYVIPGHTLGTLATVFTVHDKGKAHRAVAWGGTAYNFGPAGGPAADLCRHHGEIPRRHEEGKGRRAAVEPRQLRQRGREDGNTEGQEAEPAQSLRGRRGYGRPLPHRARRMRARDQGLCRGGPAGEGKREEERAPGQEKAEPGPYRGIYHRQIADDFELGRWYVPDRVAAHVDESFTASATAASPAG